MSLFISQMNVLSLKNKVRDKVYSTNFRENILKCLSQMSIILMM